MMPVYAYGHDYGNAETGGVLFDRTMMQHALTLPSATALGSLYELAGMRSALGESFTDRPAAALQKGEYVLESNGDEWFVGELALKQTRHATTARGDISRYASIRSLHLLLVVSAALIPPSVKEYHLDVVTGLPVETFSNADLRRKVRQALEGEHRFSLNGVQRLAVVRVRNIIMEGAGALIAYGVDGEITQGCIDVGGRTTDLFVAEGQLPILPRCTGRDLGIEAAADQLSARFQARYHRPLKLSELRDILRAHAQRRAYPVISANGAQVNTYELRQWTEQALANLGNEIASFIGSAWNASESGAVGSDIGRVLLVGGGAYYVVEPLRARISHLVVSPHPELANALGYAALANELSQRERVRIAGSVA
jgi:plasmid segregation protein ParM